MARSPFLAGILAEQHVSKEALIRRSGLSKPTVYDACAGNTVSLETMARIARALDVPLCLLDPDAADDLDGLIVR